MTAVFYHFATLKDKDAICVSDGGESVSNDDGRPAL
jgi:hypothetical protein